MLHSSLVRLRQVREYDWIRTVVFETMVLSFFELLVDVSIIYSQSLLPRVDRPR